MRFRIWLMCSFFILNSFVFFVSIQAQTLQKPFRILTTKDGLPQSFISSMVQDSTGFVWIGTRDGLARYDGRKFKTFRHIPRDTTTLSNNTITSLHLDKHKRLWIGYETGDIDLLNTETEALFHFTKDTVYKAAYASVGADNNISEDADGNIWLLMLNRGLFICNLKKHTSRFYSEASLGLQNNKIVCITPYKGNIILVTDTALITVNKNMRFIQTVPYNFTNPHLYISSFRNTVNTISNSNKIIILNKDRFILYDYITKTFTVISLPLQKDNSPFFMAQDNSGQVFFHYDSVIYKLSTENKVSILKTNERNLANGFISMLADRSGVLWLGGNASGIYQYDMRLSRITGKPYLKNFHEDILLNYLHVPFSEIQQSILKNANPYEFRWMEDNEGRIWFSRAISNTSAQPQVCYYKNGHLTQPQWHYTDSISTQHSYINAMTISRSGKLWGMDFYLRPVYFDTLTHTITVYKPVTKDITLNYNYTVNGLLIDNENDFWISTAMDGLLLYDKKKDKTIHYSYGDDPNSLPTNQLMNLIRDPSDSNILWIGSLGGGLIKFNKTTGKSLAFTTNEGLPDNTVYAIITDAKGMLWCSSNKGIFLFDTKKGAIRSFTFKDGLAGDEFNRYHFLKLPDGRIAFGGVDGYTVFNPLDIATDNFQPEVALTGIRINNLPADFGFPRSPLKAAINSLNEIKLDYNQNFLAFEFAAFEYNITEKLQYRYMLQGFEDKWVNAGNDNVATYTKLPPGHYTLKVNASNTTGQWSSQIRTLSVIVRPPFWRTWWAYSLYVLLIIGLIWVYLQYRINREKLKQEVLLREKEAMQLKTIDELKTRFFSNITHEFRTPLTLILIPVQRLKLILKQLDELHWVSAIERNANQLLRLINQLLDFSKLESGALKVYETRGNICDTIEEFIASFYDEAKANDISLKFTSHCDLGDYLFDADKLEQIIRNLVANALKFISKGGKVEVMCHTESTVPVKSKGVPGKSDSSASGLFITIRDTGIGIPEDQLPYIFNRFYQIDNVSAGRSAASHPKGSGIGLALVKELVDLQGGTIGVNSSETGTEEWRTVFNIWLPYRKAIAGKEPDNKDGIILEQISDNFLPAPDFTSASLAAIEENEEKEGAAILLVEDNDELAEFIADSLPKSYSIRRAANGADGLEQAFALMPDMVISDVLMPVMDGYEFCSKIKKDNRTNHIPVMLLTAKATFDNRIEGLSLGADDYLTKPFHIKELQLRVRNLLGRQRLLREKMRLQLSQPDNIKNELSVKTSTDLQEIFIKSLYDLIEKKLDDTSFGVQELASGVGMGRTNLHNKLKAITGLPPGEIIRNYRLKRAAEHLQQGYNSSETAYHTGFDSPAYFSKCFKEFYHVTPLEFVQKSQ